MAQNGQIWLEVAGTAFFRIYSAIVESRGKIECRASVGFPDRCPAFDFSAVVGNG
jgi:hypothetical protein